MGSVETILTGHIAGPRFSLPTHNLSQPYLYSMSHDLLQDDGLSDWSRKGCLEERGDHELYGSPAAYGVVTEESWTHLRPYFREGAGEIRA